ncbi:site-specific integrase [Flavobacterium sp. DG1-102-2]|uniref:site-specific integrase n=1 Tax=Flavobacterium sp. DG1-102-2 TaxID=3081663 RepID=UPI00294914FB|nr:site-specific integrase [Flavobacterium sp. DG1-102-2]MDV6169373.1 site-specific integrase [Flavobacterium sp. DG1-102-2]
MKNDYYNVRADIRTDKKRKDGYYPIYLFVYCSGVTQKLSLAEYIPKNIWDKEKERVNAKGYGNVNSIILQKKNDVLNFIRKCLAEGNNVSQKDITNYWNGKADREVDFYKFYASFCQSHFKKIKPATQSHYRTLEKKLKMYSPKLKFKDINYVFTEGFKEFLEDTGSGTYNMIKFLKTTLDQAMKLKLLTDDSWRETSAKSPEGERVFLTPAEVKRIHELKLYEFDKRLSESRDFFLFCCYSGLRYSDANNLTHDNYKEGMLCFNHQKTGNRQETPMTIEAKLIFYKYLEKAKPQEKILPDICNQTLNLDLKVLAKEAKINKNLTSHVGRHTFAVTLLGNNVNPFNITYLMGHKKLNQSFSYTHIMPENLRGVVKNVSFGQSPLKNSSKDKS